MYYNENEYLRIALESGMIDEATLQAQIEMAERKRYLEGHNIWQGKNGSWYTKLMKDGVKTLIRKSTKEAVEKEIIRHERELEERPTVKDVFYMYLQQKLRYGEITQGTYDRYEEDYNRYIKDKYIEKMVFSTITEEILEDFIKTTISEKKLTSKGYANLRTIIRGMLLFAKGKYTNISAKVFFGDIQFSKNTFRHKVIVKEDQVFSEEEAILITDYIKQHPSLINLLILLAFQTGMRVGELVALKKTDISRENDMIMIHVRRTEVREKVDGKMKCLVREYPKTSAGDRYVFVAESANWTLEQILSISQGKEFMFENKTKRYNIVSADHALRRICNKLGIKERSMHKIRKTYGTTLIDAGVDEAVIIEQMGHSDIHCTKQYYYFSNKKREKKAKQISEAMHY